MVWGRKATPEMFVTGAGVKELLDAQLELLEKQLDRQENAMSGRLGTAATRANILIGSSAVLGGAELVTGSEDFWFTSLSLALYLVAVLMGLWSFRSRLGQEPDLAVIVAEFAPYKTVSMRRELLLSRLQSHETAVSQLNARHRFLITGFSILGIAFAASAIGTAVGLASESDPKPTEIRLVD